MSSLEKRVSCTSCPCVNVLLKVLQVKACDRPPHLWLEGGDAVLIVGETVAMRVHREVLSSMSTMFKSIIEVRLSDPKREMMDGVLVVVRSGDPGEMVSFIETMYHGMKYDSRVVNAPLALTM